MDDDGGVVAAPAQPILQLFHPFATESVANIFCVEIGITVTVTSGVIESDAKVVVNLIFMI